MYSCDIHVFKMMGGGLSLTMQKIAACFCSKRSLMCVLLHNENLYDFTPIGHSKKLKENYEYIEKLLKSYPI